ncbi:S1/P1 nuclease-like protein [Rhexocercosporidium sp. MPI-PUGE-AT-0058]|nr:S1/P1 nuclease-like protein [Rhexocercosporidium sp. MPI-PUGE-AT-0058]
MKVAFLTPLVVLSSIPSTLAWGTLGHTTVAYVASNFVQAETRDFFQNILHNTSDAYLAGIATWADSFRYTAAGRFSGPFHFIDAEDSPPSSCGVKYARDCGEQGCVVGAIQNYTRQLLNPDLNGGLRNMAAKFVVHLLGDIHQPLHVENLEKGGNGIQVLFNGAHVNLHHVWDTSIAEKLVGGYGLPLAEEWAKNLSLAITENEYKSLASSWLDGIDLADPVTTSLGWAEETNKFVCTAVLPAGAEGVKGMELNGTYYENAAPIVKMQVAKAGYRLAKWLDLIVQGQVKNPEL